MAPLLLSGKGGVYQGFRLPRVRGGVFVRILCVDDGSMLVSASVSGGQNP